MEGGHRTGGRPRLDHSPRPSGGDSPCRFSPNGSAETEQHVYLLMTSEDRQVDWKRDLHGKAQHCRYFLQGHCHRGADCSFAHGEAELQFRKSDKGTGGSARTDAEKYRTRNPVVRTWAPLEWVPGAMPLKERKASPKKWTPKLRCRVMGPTPDHRTPRAGAR